MDLGKVIRTVDVPEDEPLVLPAPERDQPEPVPAPQREEELVPA
jgi:hypothetical protein